MRGRSGRFGGISDQGRAQFRTQKRHRSNDRPRASHSTLLLGRSGNLRTATALWQGPMYWLSDWPVGEVPQVGSLVYKIWNRDGLFVYVGISGRSASPGRAR